MKNVGVIGGGIIGLCTAYYLNKSGHKVTILDQGELTDGCSWGNAGMIVPSHSIPFAAPGMISKGIRWMFDARSPFYIRPRWSLGLVKWGYYFYKNATLEHVERSVPILKEISLLSKALYADLSKALPGDFGYRERGLLMLYQTAATEHEELETACISNRHGIEAQVLGPKEIQALEPDVEVRARGGVYFPGDAHLTPQELVPMLIAHLKSKGVSFMPATQVTDFIFQSGALAAIVTDKGDFAFDEVVLAAGSWSGTLAAHLNLSLLLQGGKGYSFMIKDRANIRVPSILLEARVAVTPMGSGMRFGGTFEMAGLNHQLNMGRVKGIVDAIPKYYPGMNVPLPAGEAVWCGLRPCSPDGLPYIGRLSKFRNVILATGHSMMGLSLGPATGKLISEIVNEEKGSMNIAGFNPERFD